MASYYFLDRVLQQERITVPVCLLAVIVLCWAYLLAGAGTMQDMGGMAMPMSTWPWSLEHAVLMFVMWLVMMAAMMLPSAAPVILLYGTLSRRSSSGAYATPAFFTLGYLALWTGFSLAAVFIQFLLEWTQLLSPMMETNNSALSGMLLVTAGIYQFTPMKRICLDRCRSPLEFFMSHWRPGRLGAVTMGMQHGMYCVACCWGLMLLLFVGGVMNLIWIAGIAVLVLIEKVAPGGLWLGRLTGAGLIGAGVIILAVR